MTDYTLLASGSMWGNERWFFQWFSVVLESRAQTSWFEAGDLWLGWSRGKSNLWKREHRQEIQKCGQLSANPDNLPAKLGHVAAKVLPVSGKIKTLPAKAETLTTNAETLTTDAGTTTANAGSLTANAGTMTTDAGSLTANAGTMTTDAGTPTSNAVNLTANAGTLTTNADSLTTNAETMTTNAETLTTNAGTLTTEAGSKCGNVLVCTANIWAVTGKIKTSAARAPGRQEFFYNNLLGVPLCLRAFVAIFTAGESVFKKRRHKWQFQ